MMMMKEMKSSQMKKRRQLTKRCKRKNLSSTHRFITQTRKMISLTTKLYVWQNLTSRRKRKKKKGKLQKRDLHLSRKSKVPILKSV